MVTKVMNDDLQASHDEFYWKHGKCCACCDHWKSGDIILGECLKSSILSGRERLQMIGMESTTLGLEAGHALTKKDYVCGNFKDDFDWKTLPIFYLKGIGAKL